MWTFKIKSLVMVFLMIILNTLLAFGQDVPLDSMKTPESPAFMLLGISPTNFSKPETPNAFAVNVLNGFSNKDIVPQNFAIETAPYWWFQQYNLTFYEYINPGIWQSIQQNFSFSAATSKISSAPGGTFLAGGVRTIICPGSYDSGKLDSLVNEYYKQSIKQDFYTNIVESDINNKNYNLDSIIEKELKEYTKPKKINISNEELQKKLDEIRTVKNNYFKTKKKENDSTLVVTFPTDSTEAAEMVEDLLNLSSDKELESTLSDIRSINQKKTGFIMDFALAGAGFFPNDSVKNGQFAKWGLWITPTYNIDNFDLLAILKVQDEKDSTTWKVSGNTGLRVLYTNDAFGISFETEGKFSSGLQPKFRYLLNFDYAIGKNTYITATFGKDFQGNIINGNGDLITLLGINFGLGGAPVVSAETK